MSNRRKPSVALSVRDADRIVGGLSYPTKMPGTAWGISARACIAGSRLVGVPGSTCHDCYALKGNYRRIPRVAAAHQRRLEGLADPRWTDAVVVLLRRAHGLDGLDGRKASAQVRQPGWHRWLDSGDLQSVRHLAMICEVAAHTPELRHWLATRELKTVLDYHAAGGTVPDNLLIRVSATMVDGPATTAWEHTSTVHHRAGPQGHACPAPTQDNYCASCRACWSGAVPNVSYHKH